MSSVVPLILVLLLVDLIARELCFPTCLVGAVYDPGISSGYAVELAEQVSEGWPAVQFVIVTDCRCRQPVGFVLANAGSCRQDNETTALESKGCATVLTMTRTRYGCAPHTRGPPKARKTHMQW